MSVIHLQKYGPGLLVVRTSFDERINAAIKDVPGREFNRVNKVWTIPLNPDNVLALRERLARMGHRLDLSPDVRAELNTRWKSAKDAAAIRAKGDHDLAFDYVTEPYAHQRAGLGFLAQLGSGALFWEMGLGKTKTAIDFAEYLDHAAGDAPVELRRRCRDCQHSRLDHHDHALCGGLPVCHCRDFDGRPLKVLVIAPNTVCRNWGNEIEKHAGHLDYALLTGISIPARVKNLGLNRYSIVNCEALSHKSFAEAARTIEWDLVIVDESTRFKTPTAARTKALHRLRRKHAIVLTGTPITGKPEDAWSQLEFVAPGTFGKSFHQFAERYLYKDWAGHFAGMKAERKDELVARIDTHGYRILKTDVLDLPPKVYVDRTVTMKGDQRKAYEQMRDELRVELEGHPEYTAFNILTVLLRLTQITAGLLGERGQYEWIEDNAKVSELDDLLHDELAGEQVVIFGQYQAELEQLARRYDKVAGRADNGWLPIIYGPTPEMMRARMIERFQKGDERLLFAQARTGGIGINLTAAQTAIYYTRSWSLEEYLQSQDRLHRIGQTGTVSIVHLLAEASIDQDIAAALVKKQGTADELTGDAVRALARQITKG